MLFRTFTRLLLPIVGILLFLAAGLFAGYLGYLGPGTQAWLQQSDAHLRAFYWANDRPIGDALKIAGLVVTGCLGALSFLSGWHYGEANLPRRLLELVEHGLNTLKIERGVILGPYLSPEFAVVAVRPAPQSTMARLRSWFVRSPQERVTTRLMANFDRLTGEIGVLSAKLRNARFAKATAHLRRGLEMALEAHKLQLNGITWGQKNEEVLAEFKEALLLVEGDVDALELIAKQLAQLGRFGTAREVLIDLNAIVAQLHDGVGLTKLVRYNVATNEMEGRDLSVADSNGLKSAQTTLENRLDVKHQDKVHELARTSKLLADVQLKREKFTASGKALIEAERYYENLEGPEGVSGRSELRVLRNSLDDAKRDPEDLGQE